MPKFNGFGGGLNMNLVKQAQQMQQQMMQAQAELDEMELTGTSGGGLVSVVIDGKKNVKSISINPSVVDADDIEMLEDLLIAAFNDAHNQQEQAQKEKMGAFGALGGMLG